jgi:hypothetical protein
MGYLNLYLIRGSVSKSTGDNINYDDNCLFEANSRSNKFMIKQYFVVAKSERDAMSLFIPYSSLGTNWNEYYFYEQSECITVCKDIELSRNWPLENHNGKEFIYSEELSKIGYNKHKLSYQPINKLSYNDMYEYFLGLSQIIAIEFLVKNEINNKTLYNNQFLILPHNFNILQINLTQTPTFIDWIRKPMNQLSKAIYNNNPEEAIKSWSKGLMTPNCDENDYYCKSHCCCHILNEFYNDNIDVKQMSKLILLLKKS